MQGSDGGATAPGSAYAMPATGLADLHAALTRRGYTVVGPTVRDGAIVLAQLDSAADLPYGWGVALEPGGYRLRRRGDEAAFAHSAGPQSWKRFLHPPRVPLMKARRTADGFTIEDAREEPRRYAFLGVRPCDLRAIGVQDRVFTGGRHPSAGYAARREAAFIVALACTEPGQACFCASMGSGPDLPRERTAGYDLALTELDGRFLIETGTQAGREVLAELPAVPADEAAVTRARAEVGRAAERMGREMPAEDLRDLMAGSLESRRWDDVAERCLSCGNCTMVCPTCFCVTVEDVTDLAGEHAERVQRWDSCFDLDFSYLHGGSVRTSPRSRYRQWLTHKLGTWHDQFGESGCVGCGRCIVWCPAGIDLTEEVAALVTEHTGEQGTARERTGEDDTPEGST